MRDITKVRIDKLIVHMLERKRRIMIDGVEQEPQRFVLSDECAPLDPKSELATFLGDHIVESVQDASAKAALFLKVKAKNENEETSDEEKNPLDPDQPLYSPLEVCHAILHGEDDFFIDGSQDLAKRLWQVLLGNDAIADGDLAVCLFTVLERSKLPVEEKKPYLALIKLEPVGAFRNVIFGEDTDQTLVTLESDPYVFPRRTDILQKGAYIQPLDKDGRFNILLVDKQTRRNIAQFFTRDFLKVGLIEDAAEKTLRLFEALVSALNDLLKGFLDKKGRRVYLTSDQYLYLAKEIYDPFSEKYAKKDPVTGKIISQHKVFDGNGRFVIQMWLNRLKLPVDQNITPKENADHKTLIKAIIADKVSKQMKGEKAIEIDLALVQYKTGRRNIVLQKRGTYNVPKEEFEGMIKSIRWIGNRYEVVFETTTWHEKLR